MARLCKPGGIVINMMTQKYTKIVEEYRDIDKYVFQLADEGRGWVEEVVMEDSLAVCSLKWKMVLFTYKMEYMYTPCLDQWIRSITDEIGFQTEMNEIEFLNIIFYFLSS